MAETPHRPRSRLEAPPRPATRGPASRPARPAPPSGEPPRGWGAGGRGTGPSLRARPQPGDRSAVGRPSPWGRRLLNGTIIALVVAILLTSGGYFYLRYQIGQINRIDIPELMGEVAGEPMNVLLVGSDSRERVEGDLADATGKGEAGTAGRRSDTMMVLHVDPERSQAAILSIPRDLWVNIPGHGNERINSAYSFGGAPLLVQTLTTSLGIDIHHYVEVDFVGFEKIVNTVGGVEVYFAAPARDVMTGLDVPEAGCIKLDGYQALALVRSRFYESKESGRWIYQDASDWGRIERQQDFIRRMIRRAVSQGVTNPLTLNRLVGIGVDNVTIDSGMSTGDIVRIARRFRNLDPNTVDMMTLPATGFTTSGGAQVLRIDWQEAQRYIDRINGKAEPEPTAPRPAETKVRVLNGNGRSGAAMATGLALEGVGFGVADKGDASHFDYRRSEIRHAPGQADKAQLLLSYLVSGATVVEDPTLASGTVHLVYIVGADYAGVRPGPAGPDASPVTSTTMAPAGQTAEPARGAGAPSC